MNDAVEELLDAGVGAHVQNKNVRKNGEVISCEWHNRAVTNASGSVQSIFSKFQDVTERENRKSELEEYETIIKALPDAVYVLNEEGRFTYVGDEFVELVGYDRETILGSTPSLIKDAAAVEKSEHQLGRLLSSDGPDTASFEVTIHPRDGDPIVCEDHMGVLPYDGDQFDGSVGTLRDITDRKERERELAQTHDLMANMERLANVGAWEYDPGTETLVTTDGTCRIYGLDLDADLTLTESFEFFHPDDRDLIRDRFDTCLETGEPYETDVRLMTFDGDQRWVTARGERVSVGGNGSVVRGYIEDITDHKERKRQLDRERERYTTLSEALPNPVLHARTEDGEPVVETVNPAFEDTFGYGIETIRNEPLQEYILPENQDDAPHRLNRQILRDGMVQTEVQRETTDGVRTFKLNVRTSDADGENVDGYAVYTDITEQKQLEHALKEERDLVTGIVETVPVGLSVVDPDGSISFVNDRVEAIGGRPFEELEDMSHDDPRYDLVDEYGDPLESGETPFNRVASRETAIHDQVMGIRRSSGERAWLSVSGAPQYNDSDELERAVFAFEDITEQRALQAELLEILGRISDAFFALDDGYRVTHVNDRGEELLEASEDQLLGETLWDIYPQIEESDKIWDSFRAAMDTQDSVSLDFYSPKKNWYDVTVYPSESGLSVYFQDVTERKNREQELQDLKNQYQTLAENFPNGAVYLVDADLKYIRAGGEELRKVSLSPDDVEGTRPHALFPERIADELCHYFEEALDGSANTFEQEYEGERYQIQTAPVRTDDERIEYVMAVSQNITERVERRRELERQNERLEEFASIVSHDLRNPLQVASGRLELVSKECESGHIDDVAQALDRIDALIEDLLTLAREGEDVSEVESVGLVDVAESSWQAAETAHATLETHATKTLRADRSRLKQLLENLYRNAVEHGGDDVTVSVEPIDDGFCVADTGPGIPESDRDEVFEAGYSTNEDGTGFGLRIVKQVADAHGWEIAVTDSDVGGARFEITRVDTPE
ncbi:PAS domain S-box protein [Halorubrum sp. BOL3-1]|nr:PAS domain S-box protein [Halorubrum sp. BOL3-1]